MIDKYEKHFKQGNKLQSEKASNLIKAKNVKTFHKLTFELSGNQINGSVSSCILNLIESFKKGEKNVDLQIKLIIVDEA